MIHRTLVLRLPLGSRRNSVRVGGASRQQEESKQGGEVMLHGVPRDPGGWRGDAGVLRPGPHRGRSLHGGEESAACTRWCLGKSTPPVGRNGLRAVGRQRIVEPGRRVQLPSREGRPAPRGAASFHADPQPRPAFPTTWPATVHVLMARSWAGSRTPKKVSIASWEPNDEVAAGEVHQKNLLTFICLRPVLPRGVRKTVRLRQCRCPTRRNRERQLVPLPPQDPRRGDPCQSAPDTPLRNRSIDSPRAAAIIGSLEEQ